MKKDFQDRPIYTVMFTERRVYNING